MPIDLSELNAAELDELIAAAAKRRVELKPDHPMQPPEQCEATFSPAWHTSPLPQGALFILRHPAFGWLGFVLPHEHRVHLSMLWLHQSLLHKPAEVATTPAMPEIAPTNLGSGGSGTLH
jgi:hypothetical protein